MQDGGATPAQGSGLTPNVAALLSYLLFTPIGGIIFYVMEKNDRFVRFHAMQSIVFGVAWIVLFIVSSILGVILGVIFAPLACIVGLFQMVLGIGGFVLWVILMIKAYQNSMWKLPFLGDIAAKYVS